MIINKINSTISNANPPPNPTGATGGAPQPATTGLVNLTTSFTSFHKYYMWLIKLCNGHYPILAIVILPELI